MILANELGLLEHVPLVLVGVEVTEAEPEGTTTNKGNAGDSGVVPDQQGVIGQRSKGLANRGGNGAHEQVDTHDERLHVLRGLGVGILVGGDVGKDFGETNQDVGQALGPDIDGGGRAELLLAVDDDGAVGVIAARALLVDVVLHDSGGNHGKRGNEETSGHTLDGGESDANLAETGVQEVVDEGNHDDNGDGVQVLDNVVGDTVKLHGTSLDGQITSHLVVGQEEDGQEEEDLAGHETTADLVNPGIVVSHPVGSLRDGDARGANNVPVDLEKAL